MLREHWEFLRALDNQLANAVSTFQDGASGTHRSGGDGSSGGGSHGDGSPAPSFVYDVSFEVAREWNGAVLEVKAPKPTLTSKKGLTKEEYKKITATTQWIRGALEGATRIMLLSLEAMPMPPIWQRALPLNAMENIGVRLYNELSVDEKFNAEKLADRENFFGHDACDEEADADDARTKSHFEASAMLDLLEKSEAIWTAKLKEQQLVDSMQTIKAWSHGARAKMLARRIRNSSAFRRVLYTRYPNVERTSLHQMKSTKNTDVALAALCAYSSELINVASSLRERAMDVIDAHHKMLDEPNPLRKRPKSLGVAELLVAGASRTREFVHEFARSIEKSLDESLSLIGGGPSVRGCCHAVPSAASVAHRSPAAIHYISESDSHSDDADD
jgi:hypothetical protein